jgi:hypothetical protein
MSLLTADTANQKSKYSPYLSVDQIRRMELECVTQEALRDGEIPLTVCHVKRYYRRFEDEIGAANGQKTKCILVQYSYNGDVHGYPVTEAYLQQQIAG